MKEAYNHLMLFYFIPDCFKTQGIAEEGPWWLKDVPDKSKKQGILEFIPDNFKTQEMCIKVAEENPWTLRCVPDRINTQGMCERAVESEPYTLAYVPDYLKTKEMCEWVVEEKLELDCIPDHFKTQGCVKKLLKRTHGSWNMFLTFLKHKNCVPRPLK